MAAKKSLRDALRAIGGKVTIPKASHLAWLSSNDVPKAVVDEMGSGFLSKGVYVGSVMIYSAADIESVNSKGGIPVALKHRLMIVGSCPNGDPVVVDLQDKPGAAGYLCHETMWSSEDIRAEYIQLAPSLSGLIMGLANKAMPMDYFEAKEARGRS
jgi:hypothetical protein